MNNHKCVVCGHAPSDRAHLVARSVLPKEEEWNPKYWVYLCRVHHTMQHTIGIITFCNRFGLLNKLKEAGFSEWRINDWLEKHKQNVR